jgi:hypothetical protein
MAKHNLGIAGWTVVKRELLSGELCEVISPNDITQRDIHSLPTQQIYTRAPKKFIGFNTKHMRVYTA